jgi:CCR4-NOT transcription complex subunit 1
VVQSNLRNSNNSLREELLNHLIPPFLGVHGAVHPNASPVLQRLWQINHPLIINYMLKTYFSDRAFLSRIIEIADEIKGSLNVILDTKHLTFSIDLAALANRRGVLNLEKCLQLRLNEHGPSFAQACLSFLQENYSRMESKNSDAFPTLNETHNSLLSKQAVSVFLRCLAGCAPALRLCTCTDTRDPHGPCAAAAALQPSVQIR